MSAGEDVQALQGAQRGRAERRIGTVVVALLAVVSLFGSKEEPGPERGVAPLVEKGKAAAERGEWDGAIAAYSEALERTPWNTRFQRLLAVAYAERAAEQRRKLPGAAGLDAAAADLRKAIELDGSDATFKRNLGVVLLERASYETDAAHAAELRAEGARLAPDAAAELPDLQRDVERRLDLAVELIERGQIEAALRQLESLRAEQPQRAEVGRLLAQAHVRAGNEAAQRREPALAAQSYQRAVAVYAELAPCDGTRCSPDDQRTAYQNLIVALYESGDPLAARAALDQAQTAGMRFPELSEILR
jgi:tetratricopeptide (TPR) repeat protein